MIVPLPLLCIFKIQRSNNPIYKLDIDHSASANRLNNRNEIHGHNPVWHSKFYRLLYTSQDRWRKYQTNKDPLVSLLLFLQLLHALDMERFEMRQIEICL
jgi:hypothetical protein